MTSIIIAKIFPTFELTYVRAIGINKIINPASILKEDEPLMIIIAAKAREKTNTQILNDIFIFYFIPFLSQYHLIMPAFVSQVLNKSAIRPNARIKNICLKESGNPVTIKNAGRTANNAVVVMNVP